MEKRKLKELKDILPARGGVKLKRREPPKPIQQEEPQIIENVRPPENAPPPTEEARKYIAEKEEAKSNLMDAMLDFNKLLTNRKLAENRSTEEKENEQKVINNLAQSALDFERYEKGKGLIAVCVLAIRQALMLRDAGNSLAYETQKLSNKIVELEKKINQIEGDIYEDK